MSDRNDRYVFLDALRGLAALSVVLFHAAEGNHISKLLAWAPKWVGSIVEHGNLGVAVFFVLSGFVIARSLRNQRMRGANVARFMLRRSIRLDPPYWAAIGLGLFVAFAVHWREAPPFSFDQLVAHLFYAQDLLGYAPLSSIFWTLCLEVQFYLTFALILWATRNNPAERFQGKKTALAMTLALLIALIWPLGIPLHVLPGSFLPLWHGFLLGVFTFWAWQEPAIRRPFFFYAAIIMAASIARHHWFSIACALSAIIIFAVARADQLSTALGSRPLQLLGAISYSLYLFHNSVTGATFRIGYALAGHTILTEIILWPLSVTTCIVFAGLVWRLIERPSIALARRVNLTNTSRRAGARSRSP